VRRLVATLVALTALPLGACSGDDAARPAPLATTFPAGPGPRLLEQYGAEGPLERTLRVDPELTSVRVRISCRTPGSTSTGGEDLQVEVGTFGTGAGCNTIGGPAVAGLSTEVGTLAPDGRLTIRVTPPEGARWSVAIDESTD
jgi:hypothetical protein